MKARPALRLSLQFGRLDDAAAQRAALPRHQVARCIRAALEQAAEITVRIVGADEGRALNRDYRGQDHATNVLTFAYGGAAGTGADEIPAGGAAALQTLLRADLVLCAPVVAREARARRLPLAAHYAHLLVHGTLHAQGWDHETSAADADAMEARETEVLAGLGLPDPYRRRRPVRPRAAAASPARR